MLHFAALEDCYQTLRLIMPRRRRQDRVGHASEEVLGSHQQGVASGRREGRRGGREKRREHGNRIRRKTNEEEVEAEK